MLAKKNQKKILIFFRADQGHSSSKEIIKWYTYFFAGIMGQVYIDEIGDRIADYSLLNMIDIENGEYEVRCIFNGLLHYNAYTHKIFVLT